MAALGRFLPEMIGRNRPFRSFAEKRVDKKSVVHPTQADAPYRVENLRSDFPPRSIQATSLSEPDFNVDHALSWAKIDAGLFQQNRPKAHVH
jgi:hypothetical protein